MKGSDVAQLCCIMAEVRVMGEDLRASFDAQFRTMDSGRREDFAQALASLREAETSLEITMIRLAGLGGDLHPAPARVAEDGSYEGATG